MSNCEICGYLDTEVDIVDGLCSVHRCEDCGAEGYATGPDGYIKCEQHGGP